MCNTAGIVDRILGVSNVLVGRIFVEEFLNEDTSAIIKLLCAHIYTSFGTLKGISKTALKKAHTDEGQTLQSASQSLCDDYERQVTIETNGT